MWRGSSGRGGGASCRSGSSPSLPAEHAHAGRVDPDKPPGSLLAVHGQRLDEGVGRGTIRVPVLGVDAPAPAVHGRGVPALGLKKVLFEHTVINVHLPQDHHLLALDVRGGGLVPHPHADAVAHRELAPVEDRVGGRPLAPASPVGQGGSARLQVQILSICGHRRGVRAEQHAG